MKEGSAKLQGQPGHDSDAHTAEWLRSTRAPGEEAADASSTQIENWLRAAARLSAGPPAPEAPLLRTGTRLRGGRFVVGKMLGKGGMGAVYEVRDLERGANLALKTLLDTRSERLLDLKNEFRALQDLTHPNLVRLDELFESDGLWFFTMERIQGTPFSSFVRPCGLDPERLRRSLKELTQGLLALHGADKIHRDVKPSNTLVERTGRVVLLDFGLVGDTRSTREGRRPGIGTAAYMAPEQTCGDGGRPADWYSVGVMLYEALTGVVPFEGRPEDVLTRKLVEAVPPPSTRAEGLPLDLENLCLDLLRLKPSRRPTGEEVLQRIAGREPTLARHSTPKPETRRFVGRTRELDLVRKALAKTSRTGPITLLIQGESGVGKTALLEAFVRQLESSVIVLAGRCYEREFVPFKALDGLIDSLARHLAQIDDSALPQLLPSGCQALARIFPVLERVCRRANLPTDEGQPAWPIEARHTAFAALRDLLAGLARSGPLVLAIDDLHWADVDSLAVLEDLLHGHLAPNVLLILLGRSETRAPEISGELMLLELGALRADEARELACRLLAESPGEAPFDPAWLAEEAGRHPLFMEAMLRHGPAAGGGRIRLEDALAAQVKALPARARAVLEVVSIATQPLSPATIARASGLFAEPLFKLVRDLQTERLLLSRGEEALASIEPYHDQVRRAVSGCMAPERQLNCHRSVAEALEVTAPEGSEALAIHWRAAGNTERSRLHAIAAGHTARRALAFDRAAAFYRSALDLHTDPGEKAADLYRWHAEALANAGRGAESAASYRAAADLAIGNEKTDLLRCRAEQFLRAGHVDEGLSALDAVLGSLGMSRPRSFANAIRILVQERFLEAWGSLARRFVPIGDRRAAALARRADACWTTGLGLSWIDPVAAAVFHSRYLRLSRRLGDPVRVALGLCMRAPSGAFGGPPAARARLTLERAREVMSGRAEPFVDGYQALSAGMVAFLLGEWDNSRLHSERSMTLFRQHGGAVSWEMATAERLVLDCLWHTGQIRQLRERAWSAWREATRRGDRYAAAQVETTVLPVVHLANDDVASASAVLDRALLNSSREPLSMQHWQYSQTRSLVELYAGRPTEALRILEAQQAAPIQALISRIKAVRVFSAFLRATALLGVALQRPDDLHASLRRADGEARRIEKERIAPETVCLLRGQIDLLCDRPANAFKQFSSAETLFAQKGMTFLAAAAAHGRGVALGGADGVAIREEARRRLQAEEIRCPENFLSLFVPVSARQ